MKRLCAFLLVCLCVSPVFAILAPATYPFTCITNNSLLNAGDGQAQLSVDVMPSGSDVEFMFTNTGSIPCVITQVFFYGELLDGLVSFSDSGDGVAFESETDNPGHLPGYSPHPLIPIRGELSRVSQGGVHNGVNNTPLGDPNPEWLSAIWSLQTGATFTDLLDAMNSGSVMIGLHVQAFGDGGSEGFSHAPEPATLVLLAAGSLLLIKRQRR